MSVGLDYFVEVRINGVWTLHKHDQREKELFSYSCIIPWTGFKNEQHMAPTFPDNCFYRGYPKDSDYLNEVVYDSPFGPSTRKEEIYNDNDFALSYLTLRELIEFDYDQEFEDRYEMDWPSKYPGKILPVGMGRKTNMAEFLGEHYFNSLHYLKTLGEPDDVRVIYNLS